LAARPKPVASTCWNCDEAANELIEVTLLAPSGPGAAVRLCQPCFTSVYVPLVTDAQVGVLDRGGQRSLLVVDDDPGVRKLLTTAFQRQGFSVVTAANGLDALQKASAGVPDAIVLDLSMPVMSGQEFLRHWRRIAPALAIPVLAISAYDTSLTAEKLGVQAFLPKPLSIATLVATIGSLVGQQPPTMLG
jgi:CheY-like chemotaxis protein